MVPEGLAAWRQLGFDLRAPPHTPRPPPINSAPPRPAEGGPGWPMCAVYFYLPLWTEAKAAMRLLQACSLVRGDGGGKAGGKDKAWQWKGKGVAKGEVLVCRVVVNLMRAHKNGHA